MWEFDLLHHYTIHVTDTFDLTPRLHNLWRDRAVREATRHEFLLHMTLMISCLHLALTKSPRYADSHHRFILSGCSNAMSWFQQEMEHVDESNFRAVGPFAFLMCVYGLALPLVDETRKIADMVLDDMIQVLGLLRGTENLVKGTRQHDEQDDEPWSNEEDLRDISANISEDFDIESVVRTLRAYVSSSDDDARVRVVNYKAIHGFETSSDLNFKLYLRPFIWPNFIDLEYLDLLKQRNPIAMVILAHYAITLGQCSSQWWCADWGVRLASAISALLPDTHSQAIAYPLEKLNINSI